jgi:large subunit ribosomal protein L24
MKRKLIQFSKNFQLGDQVKIIAGDQKGLLGNILFFNKKKHQVILDSIPPRKKEIKPQTVTEIVANEKKSRLIPKEIHISNVMLWDEQIQKASRVQFLLESGKKRRVFQKSKNLVPITKDFKKDE